MKMAGKFSRRIIAASAVFAMLTLTAMSSTPPALADTPTAPPTLVAAAAGLTVTPTSSTVTAAAHSATPVTVNTDQPSWQASSDSSWLSINPTSGTTGAKPTISMPANTGPTRTGIITFTAGSATATFTVVQNGGATAPTITVTPATRTAPAAGASGNIVVDTNQTSWVASSDASWLSINPTTGVSGAQPRINVDANTGPTRTATITFTAGTATSTFTVTQTGGVVITPTVSLSQTTWAPSASGDNTSVTVTSNLPSWQATSNQSWLVVSPASGISGNQLTVSAQANNTGLARTATVLVTAGTATATLSVTQPGGVVITPTVSLSQTTWTPTANADSLSLAVMTNLPSWQATSDATWLTADPATGTIATPLTVSVQANNTGADRTATLLVTAGTATATLTVTQRAVTATVSLSQASWTPTAAGYSVNVTVTTNQPSWHASSDQTWVSVNPASGVNGGQLTLSVQANNTGVTRVANILVTAGAASTGLTVTQSGSGGVTPSVSLSQPTWTPTAGGATGIVTVTTNQPSWQASSDSSWLTLNPTSGVNGTQMTLTAQANNTGASRTATVRVTAGGATAILTVTQQASVVTPSVSLSQPTWTLSSGVYTGNVTVTTNQPSWQATSDSSWLTINPTSGVNGTQMTLTAQANNTGASRVATVHVTAGGASATLTVTQSGGGVTQTVALTQPTWTLSGGVYTAHVTVTTNQPSWQATSDSSWLTINPTSGVNGTQMTLTAQANTTGATRTATVRVTAGAATATLTFTEEGSGVTPTPGCGATVATACTWNLNDIVVSPAGTVPEMLKFTAPATGTWVFQSSGRASTSDPLAYMYNSAQTLIGYDDDSAGNLNFKITVQLVAGQTYYLAARQFGTSNTGQYTITATRQ